MANPRVLGLIGNGAFCPDASEGVAKIPHGDGPQAGEILVWLG